jgi:DNA polymerase III subunit gamma/tau
MSYKALYREWRPLTFEDVVEQEHVVKTLRHSITSGRIAHAYLFCGTRGTGKTTMAKIFARAINCLNPKDGDPCNECEICRGILSESILDVIEIDAASNNSVDNIREIRDEVIYAPSQAKYKVYIIDEVHMLSTGAFNALLKTLEEPPAHVVFILATTEPHKLPATILSRCQRFDFRRITLDSIVDRLQLISEAGGVKLQKEAARLIARISNGALRDAISVLDQCISMGNAEVSYNDVLAVVGIVNDTFMSDIVDAVQDRKIIRILELVEQLVMGGKDITQFISDLVLYYRNLLICKVTERPEEIIEASLEALDVMSRQGASCGQEELMFIIKELSLLEANLKWSAHQRVLLEVSLIKICERSFSVDSDNISDRLALLEAKVNNGSFAIRADKNDYRQTTNIEEHKAENEAAHSTGEKSDDLPKPDAKPVDNKVAMGQSQGGKGVPIKEWDSIVGGLKSRGRMVLYTNLLGTKAVEVGTKIVGILFGSGSGSFGKMMVSKAENLEVVQEVLSKKLGRDITVKCYDEEEFLEGSKTTEDEHKDELLEKAQGLADRLNVPLNIIDE